MLKDIGILALRVVAGGLLTGHGGQKLFGWFGGSGFEGTTEFMDSLGLEPAKPWATLAGGSEFAGGILTTLGLFHPIGPIIKLGPMLTAVRQVHWSKSLYDSDGPQLPLTNIAICVALATHSPGRFSLDHFLGFRVPRAVTLAVVAGVAAGLALSEVQTAQSNGSDSS